MTQIEVADYDPEWPLAYEAEAAKIRAALGGRVLELHHAGSTSVPGLPARPVIDIVLVVEDSAAESAYGHAIESAGYALRIREPEWFEHRLFRGENPAVNLHVFSCGCEEISRMLAFRDWLRASSGDRELYARTKRQLALKDWVSVQDYADAKTAVVAEIMARALARHAR